MKISEELVEAVNNLIEKNLDANEGFLKAYTKADHMRLRSYLKKQADKRKVFAKQLKMDLNKLNPTANLENKGSFKGTVHRGWIGFRDKLFFHTDEAILEECIRGDKHAIKEYKNVWNNHKDLPPILTSTLSEQVANIEQTLFTIQAMEDL